MELPGQPLGSGTPPSDSVEIGGLCPGAAGFPAIAIDTMLNKFEEARQPLSSPPPSIHTLCLTAQQDGS